MPEMPFGALGDQSSHLRGVAACGMVQDQDFTHRTPSPFAFIETSVVTLIVSWDRLV